MSSEKVTAAEAAQAALDGIKRACNAQKGEVMAALIEHPGSIAELARIAGDPDYQH